MLADPDLPKPKLVSREDLVHVVAPRLDRRAVGPLPDVVEAKLHVFAPSGK
jgi:hypothetical protein